MTRGTETIMAPADALEELDGLREQLDEYARGFVNPVHTKVSDEKPISLFLEASGDYYSDGRSEARFYPYFRIASIHPGSSYEVENFRRGQRGWVPPTRTITVPTIETSTTYRADMVRRPAVGLIAVRYAASNELKAGARNPLMPSRGEIHGQETQALFGKAFTLTALAHSLDPERIVAL